MPALLEDPHAPHHVGPPLPANAHAALQPRTVILRDHVTVASIIPVLAGAGSVPLGLVSVLHEEFNREIERGDTYPMDTPLTLEAFRSYWFGTFAAVMLLGNETALREGRDWANECLGTFYAKPNYPGRSNHICNGSFLVCHNARAKGVGKLLGEAYLDFAPKLGYTYSVFNLVFDTNHASTKIWDSLGFKRIGLVKGAGRLKGHSSPVDAIIYGRELGEDEDYVSEERFDKIRFYLEKGKYPPNADRSEKSRLRSATTHYRLEGNKLLLKDKEVISDGHEQYEIAKRIHGLNHGGINKTTAMIADKYHWVRIKETVSAVIKNCQDCKESARAPVVKGDRTSNSPRPQGQSPQQQQQQQQQQQLPQQQQQPPQPQAPTTTAPPMMQQFDLSTLSPTSMVTSSVSLPSQSLQTQLQSQQIQSQLQSPLGQQQGLQQMSMGVGVGVNLNPNMGVVGGDMDIPVDPAMMEDVTSHLAHHHQVQQHHHQGQHHVQQHHPHHQHLQHQHIAPVAQMHAAAASRLMGTDGSELQLQVDNHNHQHNPHNHQHHNQHHNQHHQQHHQQHHHQQHHQHQHQHQHQLDPLDNVNPHPHHHPSSSAEIARAALTEEGRAMRGQIVEGLRGIGDSAGVDVGLGVGGGVGVGVGVGDGGLVGMAGGQDMELDEGIYGGHGGHELAGVGGGESKDHV